MAYHGSRAYPCNIMVDNNNFLDDNGTALFYHLDNDHIHELHQQHRFLAAGGNQMVLDYTVLAVVIFTLALILVIEVGRHRLDVWASGNPFFKTVLELMYRELTTLGIVECVIYLLHKYWEDFNLAYEVVFVDIHFMLFYTAVINAIQSSLVRVLTTRLTTKQWSMTEDIDIYHYVAIRREFDRLEEQLQLEKSIPASALDSSGFFPENQNYFRSALRDIAFRIRHPYLSSRRKALIVPVRFHELRAHFIESNNLPQKFKVSPYLNLSLTSVLLEFVHISPAAWILLMASANILYFLSGAILDATEYVGSVSTFMIGVFFTVATLFAVLQFFITLKMKSIFSHIINTKTWMAQGSIDDSMDEKRSREQLNLFWGGTPHFIIVATQYMQFGYAIGLAVIAVYNKVLSKDGWVMPMLLVWLASYGVFLFLVNRMMPWYTLCTSMGQLVNKERLHQTLAKLKLKEELRKKEAILEEIKAEEEIARRKKEEEAKTARLLASHAAKSAPPKRGGIKDSIVTNVGNVFKRSSEVDKRKRRRKEMQRSISDGVQFMRNFNEADLARSFLGKTSPLRLSDAAAVKLDSVNEDQAFQQTQVAGNVDEQNNNNTNNTSPSQQTLGERRRERRRLRKTQSENVALMRAIDDDGSFALDTSTSPQRRCIANNCVPLLPIKPEAVEQTNEQKELDDHQKPSPRWFAQEELSPIKLDEQVEQTNGQKELDDHQKPSPRWFTQEELSPIKLDEQAEKQNDYNELITQPNDDQEKSPNYHPKSKHEWFTHEELSPINLDEDTKEHTDDNELIIQPSLTGQVESPSKKLLLPLPTARETKSGAFTKDDILVPSGRRALLGVTDASTPHESTDASKILDRKQERRRQRRLVTRSEGVAFMRSSLADTDNLVSTSLASVCELGEDEQLETLAGLAKLKTEDLPQIPPFEEKRRRSRLRSSSDGVSAMRMMNSARDTDSSKSLVFTEDKETVKQSSTKTLALSTDKAVKPSTRVSFALFHSLSASNALSSPTDRLSSIDSAASVDGDSDIDDVPDALPVDVSFTPSKHMIAKSRFDLNSFLRSAKYRAASFLYGPMICMLMIGRVEMFNIQSGLLYDQENTYHFRLQDSFFVECSWYCLMMLEMSFVFTYCTRQSCLNEGEGYETMKSITASGWGFLINVTCLLLLLVAESKRCCSPSSTDGQAYEGMARGLGGGYDTIKPGESYNSSDSTNTCTCMKFGSRLYGGLGTIEPFTFLIVLSPLRYLFASYTLRIFGCRRDKHDRSSHASDHNHGSHGVDVKTKARELWLSTVGAHSDVAVKFGMFSGQFLQCMLGIYSPDRSGDEYVEEPTVAVTDKDLGSSRPSTEPSIQSSIEQETTTLINLDGTLDSPKQPHQRRTAFDFESFGVVFDDFSYPSSRLIRRMRRCERRLLPFLDEWHVVDAVLTNHELVLFDVREESGYDIADLVNNLAANGGKGIRLCDVAKGRKILSQFDLKDVDFVDIEHRLATESDSNSDIERGQEQLLEFWQGGNDHIHSYRLSKMNERWCNVNEDRLKVHFKSGGGTTLFIRFTIDLKEMERRKLEWHAEEDSPDQSSNVGRQAKVWCRSIARLRGANNLTRQSLPHFNDINEMDDFIELCPREEVTQDGNRLKALLKRSTSLVIDDSIVSEKKGMD